MLSGENKDLKSCRGRGGAGWWLRMTGLRPEKEARAQVRNDFGNNAKECAQWRQHWGSEARTGKESIYTGRQT